MQLSALVCAHNEERRLADCLRRLGFCDEIVVVADRCTDRTQEIARRFGARVVDGIFPLEVHRKAAGLDACRGEWVLEIDADELVDVGLAEEIRYLVTHRVPGDWFQTPLDNYIGDRLVRHGWGEAFGAATVPRLYRRGVKHWQAQRVEPTVTFDGAFGGVLKTPIRHMVCHDIGDMLARLDRYTHLRSQDLADAGQPGEVWDNLFRGVRRFWKSYISRKGRLEGQLGFLIALMAGLYPPLSCLRAHEILRARAAHPAKLDSPAQIGAAVRRR